jgi:hypothetical protein
MIDGKFNSQITKRWNLSFQVTNRAFDSTYRNSEFGIWQVNAKLKYFWSNSVNISGSYNFVSANQGLNGGVDFDSLTQISDDPNADLYDPSIAPVLYPNQKLDIIQHNFRLRTLTKPFDKSKLDLTVYYRYNEDMIKNASVTSFDNLETRTFGGSLFYTHQELDFVELQVNTTYEKNETLGIEKDSVSSSTSTSEYNYDYFTAYGLLRTDLFNKVIQPTLYYKYENIGWERISMSEKYVKGNSGIGGDINIVALENFSFYLGYSRVSQFGAIDVETFEAGGIVEIEGLFADLKYFSRINFIPYDIWVPWWTSPELGYSAQNVKGFGGKLFYKLWVIRFESDFSYYFDKNKNNRSYLPDIQFKAGLFVNDYFFEENLYLKSGLVFHYTGELPGSVTSGVVIPSNKLDFTLAGEIKGAAIFYFIWENLFNNQYYITPYYPMPERNIRFGLAWELFD